MDIAAVIRPDMLRLNSETRAQLDRIESGVIIVPRRRVVKREVKS